MTLPTPTRPAWLQAPSIALGGSQLLAVAAAQPELVVTADSLGRPFGRTSDWIETRTGIREVRRAEADTEILELAVAAAATAMCRAGVRSEDVDLVITASCSLAHKTSARIASAAAGRAGWMAINSACSGFCYALSTADDLIRTGAARTVLIVAAEHMSALLDPADLATSIVFGDGAGAAVVGRVGADATGVGPLVSGSDGKQQGLIACAGDGLLHMAGREVFRWAVETVPGLAVETCRRAGIAVSDLAAFIPHQANKRIIDAVAARLDLRDVVVATDISRSGNTSAASIPIALDRLLAEHPQISGRHALLLGFGAGLAYAGQVVRLP